MSLTIVMTFWAKKSIFPELVRQNAADPDQIRCTWTCQGVTTFRLFWARSAHFGQNGGWDEFRGARVFCGKPEDLSATSQRPISTTFGHEKYFGVPSRNPETFSKIFTLGVICPQNLKSKIGQTGISLRVGYMSRDTLQRDSVSSL